MINDYMIGKVLLILFMAVVAVIDYRESAVSIRIFAAAFFAELAAVFFMCVTGVSIDWADILLGIAIGVVLGVISVISGGRLGMGDALYFIIAGIAAGGKISALIFSAGIMISALYGTALYVIMVFGKGNKKNVSFPLLPAMLPAGVIAVVLL